MGSAAVAAKRNKACPVCLRVPGAVGMGKCALQVSGVDSGVKVSAGSSQGPGQLEAGPVLSRAEKRLKGDRRAGKMADLGV